MPPSNLKKIIVYRAIYRLTPGQHHIWSDMPDGHVSKKWEYAKALKKHLRFRKDVKYYFNMSSVQLAEMFPTSTIQVQVSSE